MQEELADIQKENIIENLEKGLLNYKAVEKFLTDLKEEFDGGDNKMLKVRELKKIEQKSKMMKKFVQEFRRVARKSGYERRPLVEEFKRGMNGVICQGNWVEESSTSNLQEILNYILIFRKF